MIYDLDGQHPELPDSGDYWVAPDANVIGQVKLETATSVWFGATLRGDNEVIHIGAGSNIQENCVLHTDMGFPLVVGENCTIGHRAILHGCTIGDQTLVGMGAIIMNGAVIGQGCQIGAGTLISEGKTIPDGSLVVGVPGKIIRTLNKSAQSTFLASAKGYQVKMRVYKDLLKQTNPS
ncbi:MAG: gamma carbonic anhydrase family protein [Paracoccaceae bacterium]